MTLENKTFRSNKLVRLVKVMTRGEYNEFRGWTTPEDENPEDAGYLIEYLDGGKPNHPDHEGYISWSPKDVFDRNHSPVSERGKTAEILYLDDSPFLAQSTDQRISHIEPDPTTPLERVQVEEKELTKRHDALVDIMPRLAEFNIPPLQRKLLKLQRAVMFAYGRILTKRIEHWDSAADFDIGFVSFSTAVEALKSGFRVQRQGWNGKDMWLSVSNLSTATVYAENFWSPHNAFYAAENGGEAEVPPCITIKNAKGQIQMGWLPSQEDIFAEDWVILD